MNFESNKKVFAIFSKINSFNFLNSNLHLNSFGKVVKKIYYFSVS